MNRHPYMRAYMAGIAVPTAFLIVALTVFCVARFVCQVPVPIERVIVFPMALIPNLWGAWNMLYVALPRRRAWTIGVHGALLPLILGPMGYVVATLLGVLNATRNGLVYFDVVHVPFTHIAILLPIGITVYYLAWKYLVGFLNAVLEITG
jgi:hypothetical protein